MYQVGLTGGIGSGKSTIAQVFKVLDIAVFDADSASKYVMNTDEDLKQKIKEIFGEQSYENNLLNRKYLAEIVFNDTYKLEQLNAIVHPATISYYNEWLTKQTSKYVIKEAALLFEAGSTKNLNMIVGVFAPKHIRIKRVMQRENITKEQVEARMNNQIDESMKMKLCDEVIINDEQHLVVEQVLKLHHKILSLLN